MKIIKLEFFKNFLIFASLYPRKILIFLHVHTYVLAYPNNRNLNLDNPIGIQKTWFMICP